MDGNSFGAWLDGIRDLTAEQRGQGFRALALAEKPENFLSTVQIGITVIGVLTGLLVFIPYVGFGGGLILAILAAVVVPRFLDRPDEARAARAR